MGWREGGEQINNNNREGLKLTAGTAANWKLMVTGDSRLVLITCPPTAI